MFDTSDIITAPPEVAYRPRLGAMFRQDIMLYFFFRQGKLYLFIEIFSPVVLGARTRNAHCLNGFRVFPFNHYFIIIFFSNALEVEPTEYAAAAAAAAAIAVSASTEYPFKHLVCSIYVPLAFSSSPLASSRQLFLWYLNPRRIIVLDRLLVYTLHIYILLLLLLLLYIYICVCVARLYGAVVTVQAAPL